MRLVALLLVSLLAAAPVAAAAPEHQGAIQGHVAGFRLAGIEPDGDPLDQVLLDTTISAHGTTPPLHLIVDTYLENFQPDTTPILPDLLHPNQTAQNLGGFLEGKALITDGQGDVLYNGSFLAEAFLDNTNHAVMSLFGSGAASGSRVRLKGVFRLRKDGSLSGDLAGRLSLPPPAAAQVAAHRSGPMRPLKAIIAGLSVRPHAMVGRATTKPSGVPLHTGYGTSPHAASRPPWALLAGIGAVIFFAAGIVLYWRERNIRAADPPQHHTGTA